MVLTKWVDAPIPLFRAKNGIEDAAPLSTWAGRDRPADGILNDLASYCGKQSAWGIDGEADEEIEAHQAT